MASEAATQAYFHAIEEAFIRLRGAPLLLSPADWQVARRWHEGEVPLALVLTTLEEVFARRRERGAKGRIQSLRYCADAVEAAWEEHRELVAAGERRAAAPVEVGERLAALAAALPATLPERAGWVARIIAVAGGTGGGGESEEVERRLALLDRELLTAAEAALEAPAVELIEGGLKRAVATLRKRLGDEQLAAARERLWREAVRREAGLPVLSLFVQLSSRA